MQSEETQPVRPTLSETLHARLHCETPGGLRVGELAQTVGEKGFGLLLILLALPSALPVPAPGYSTPFGLIIALIALQMMAGRPSIWLPARLARWCIPPRVAQALLGRGGRFLHIIERSIRPRQQWIRFRAGQTALAGVVLIMAGLMSLPIPLTNTAPAMVIFLIGVGLAEDDGLLALFALALGCLAILLYGGLIWLLIQHGPEAIEVLKSYIRPEPAQ